MLGLLPSPDTMIPGFAVRIPRWNPCGQSFLWNFWSVCMATHQYSLLTRIQKTNLVRIYWYKIVVAYHTIPPPSFQCLAPWLHNVPSGVRAATNPPGPLRCTCDLGTGRCLDLLSVGGNRQDSMDWCNVVTTRINHPFGNGKIGTYGDLGDGLKYCFDHIHGNIYNNIK